MYTEILGTENYIIEQIEGGEYLSDHLKESIPEVILLDWQMPKMGGVDVLRFLKKNRKYKHIPIIVITGQKKETILQDAFEYGSVDFIEKPIYSIELNARVQNVLELEESTKTHREQGLQLEKLNNILSNQRDAIVQANNLKIEKLHFEKEELNKKIIELQDKIEDQNTLFIKYNNQMKSTREALKKIISKKGGFSTDQEKTLKNQIRSIDNCLDQSPKTSFKNSRSQELIKKLLNINPKLTPLDLDHCYFILNNMSNHEIAETMHIEVKSLQTKRHRLKQKLKLEKGTSLLDFLNKLR